MRNYLDSNDKKTEIRLLLQHPSYKNKVIAVVEGNSDYQLFRKLLKHDNIEIEPVDGKKNLVLIMKELVGEFPDKLLGICDADFDHLTSEADDRTPYSVFVTDVHDAEMMMLDSPGLKSFIDEFSSKENVDHLHENAFNNALDAAYHIGLIRYASLKHNLKINFRGLNYSKFVEVNELSVTLDNSELIKMLIERSGPLPDGVNINETIQHVIENDQLKSESRLQACCGHDVTNIIAQIYRQSWASRETNMGFKRVEESLRIAYQPSYFEKTNLYNNIKNKLSDLNIELELSQSS